MAKLLFRKLKITIAGVVFGIILVVLVVLLITKSYPAEIVGVGYISDKYWEQAQIISKNLDQSLSQQKITDQQVKVKEEAQLLDSLKVPYNSQNFTDELKFYKTGKDAEYQNLLNKYFDSNENEFMEFVVKPQVYDALLRIKYNIDFYANNYSYNLAQDILNQLKSGKSFEDLAKKYSDDKISGQLGGDLGFVSSGQILPELERAVANTKMGEVDPNVVVSRLGYHILYPVETADKNGAKVWHIKQILVKTTGYDNWLNPMLNRFWVWHIR